MRALVLLVLALLAAGCTQPNAPVQPASVTPATPTDAPPANATANATEEPPTAQANDTPADNGTPPAPEAAPAPTPWNLTANAALGWLAAASTPAGAGVNKTDPDHCPIAHATIPAGATRLLVTFGGDVAGQAGVAALSLEVRDPAGKTEILSFDPTTATPGQPASLAKAYDAPAAGAWTFTAQPSPAAASATWALALQASGTALSGAPASLALAKDPSCSG